MKSRPAPGSRWPEAPLRAARSRLRRAARYGLKRALGLAAALAILIALWALAAAAVGRPFLPSPGKAFAALARRLADGSLLPHVAASARRVGLALIVAAPSASLLGLAAGRSRRLDSLVSPFVYILHPLPKVAFLPVIMLFLGLGDAAKVTLIGLVIFGQLMVAARDAGKAVPAPLIDTLKAMGAGKAAVLAHVVLPYALPSLFTALRIGLGTSVAVLFIAEGFASESGLGWYVMDAWTRVDYPDMYAAIVALSVFGLACYSATDAAEGLVCRWNR